LSNLGNVNIVHRRIQHFFGQQHLCVRAYVNFLYFFLLSSPSTLHSLLSLATSAVLQHNEVGMVASAVAGLNVRGIASYGDGALI
jgi:hypothetical protein